MFRLSLALVVALGFMFSHAPCVFASQEISSEEITKETLAAAGPAFDFAREEKIRAVYYSGRMDDRNVSALGGGGMNLGSLKLTNYRPEDSSHRDIIGAITKTAAAAEKYGQVFIPWVNWAGWAELGAERWTAAGFPDSHIREGALEYERFVDETGREHDRTPCHLDRGYWEETVARRAIELAELSRTVNVHGIAFDFEMYGAAAGRYIDVGTTYYWRVGSLSYRDEVFRDFCIHTGLDSGPGDVPAAERKSWLEGRGLLEAYSEYQEEEIRLIVSGIRERVHRINPDFIFGFYPYHRDCVFFRGVARGFGTPRMPVLVMGAATYTYGYREHLVDGKVKHLSEIGADALYISGLHVRIHAAPNLAAHAYKISERSAGYWLYGIYDLWREGRLAANPSEYFEWLAKANREIAVRASDAGHITSLEYDPGMQLFQPVEIDPHTILPLEPLNPGRILEKLPYSPMLRFSGIYLLHAEKGEEVGLSIRSVQLANYSFGVSYVILSPSREIFAEGRVPVRSTEEVSFHAPETGVYAVACRMGNNAVIVNSKGRLSILQEGMVRFTGTKAELYFYVPPGEKNFEVEVVCREAVLLDGRGGAVEKFAAETGTGGHKFEVYRENADKGEVWSIEMGVPRSLAVSKEIPPVFSLHRDTLLVPRKPLIGDVPLEEHQILYFAFDEGEGRQVKDLSPAGNHAEITGNARWVEGIIGSALEFDVDSYLEAENLYNELEELTVSFWIWQPESTRDQFSYMLGNTRRGAGFRFWKRFGDRARNIDFRIHDGEEETILNRNVLPLEEWVHVAGTFGKGGAGLYINGEPVMEREVAMSRTTGVSGEAFRVGMSGGWSSLPGMMIDELRIWNVRLSEEQVKGLYF